jgi:cobalt/nickel transport system ATP-binding protein
MTPAIEADNLSFAFDRGRNVLNCISFQVDTGERVAILGGNGAGKSTLVWCLAGLLRPQGTLRILGRCVSKARSQVGLVFQNPEDQLFMPSIVEDLVLPQVNRGSTQHEAKTNALSLLDQVGLRDCDQRPASKLSFGQRKRAAIAATLVTGPEILILDEPTAELDGRSIRELQGTLRGITATLVVVTHDLRFAAATSTRALVLLDGKVAWDGSTASALAQTTLLESAGVI